MENCTVRAGNNTIIQLYDADDFFSKSMSDGKEVDNGDPVKDPEYNATKANYHDIRMFDFDVPNYCTDARATFKKHKDIWELL